MMYKLVRRYNCGGCYVIIDRATRLAQRGIYYILTDTIQVSMVYKFCRFCKLFKRTKISGEIRCNGSIIAALEHIRAFIPES